MKRLGKQVVAVSATTAHEAREQLCMAFDAPILHLKQQLEQVHIREGIVNGMQTICCKSCTVFIPIDVHCANHSQRVPTGQEKPGKLK